MPEEMTHERCSELLRSYVSGELTGQSAAGVRAHLEGCPDCRAEERAVGVLLEGPGPTKHPEQMDDLERARLHRALAQELFARPANVEIATPGVRRRFARLAPALGAAAVLLVGLVLAGTIFGGGDDSELGLTVEGSAEDAGGGDGRGGSGTFDRADESQIEAASEPDASSGSAYNAGEPAPEFEHDAGRLTQERLSQIGRDSALFKSFSDAYSVDDAERREGEFRRLLFAGAGSARSQARECARTLPPGETLLPAYGATGDYEGRAALILGFVTTGSDSGSLDRYLMWVWAKGSCTQPIDTLFENISK